MNLQQILTEIKTIVPPSSDITDEQLVLKLNQIQRRIFRDLTLPDKMVAFQSTPESPYYDIPTDCAEDRIRNALVDNIDYPKVSVAEESPPHKFCAVFLNKLYLHPNPTTAVNVFLYYKPRYHDLIVTNLNDVPDLSEDFHELLVFGGAQWVAQTQGDIDVANNMQSEYDVLLREAKQSFAPDYISVNGRW